ncbi:MAG: hypothetical protein ACOYL6_06710 [Bacteriovoracaceae bacterium]
MSNKKLLLVLSLSFSFSTVWATTQTSAFEQRVLNEAPYVPSTLTLDEKEVANFGTIKRKPANNFSVDMETKDMKTLQVIVSELHALKTPEQVQAFIEKLEANYNSYPNNVKFFAASIIPTKAFRGSFYRLRTLFEKKSKFLHSQVLTMAKKMATRNNVYLPTDYSRAIYDYAASPYFVNGRLASTFTSEADVQIWQVKELLPLLETAASRLSALKLVEPIIWDQKIAFGPDSFQDDIGRFKQIGEFEKNIAIASIYSSISSLSMARAYSMENAIEMYKDLGSLYGFDGFGLFNAVDGVSAKKVSRVLNKRAFKNTATIMSDGKFWMSKAYDNSQNAIRSLKKAWSNSANTRSDENFYLFNTGYLNVNRDEIEQNLQIMDRVVTSQGVESLRSAVTGEVVQVNYKNLFIDPPKDLKAFLPTGFDEKSTISRKIAVAGKEAVVTYRNYAEGSPTAWNVEAFEPYFPSIKKNSDVYKTVRVLSHAGGNWLSLQ